MPARELRTVASGLERRARERAMDVELLREIAFEVAVFDAGAKAAEEGAHDRQSWRSVMAGSIRMARRSGMIVATTAATARTPIASRNATGSRGLSP